MIQWVSGISFVDENLWTTLNSINYNKELTANTVVSKQVTNVYLEDLVVAYGGGGGGGGRVIAQKNRNTGCSSEKRSGHIYFREDNQFIECDF